MAELDKKEIDANRNDSDECCFWVDEVEFQDIFNEVIVTYSFNNESYESLRLRHKKGNFSMVHFKVIEETGFGVFCARQFDSRRLSGLVKKDLYEYSLVRILICK